MTQNPHQLASALKGPVNLLAAVLIFGLLSADIMAEVPPTLEDEFAELTYSYQSGKLEEALKLSAQLLAKNPTVFEFLEVRALALKASGKTAEASQIYVDLVKKRWKESQTKDDKSIVAPYYFELGNIKFQEKKLEEAEFYLKKSQEWNFNPMVASFYLGNIYVQKERWTEAEDQFIKVIEGDLQDLKPTAHFLLAQVSFKLRSSNAGVRNLMWARHLSKKELEDPGAPESGKAISKKINEATEKVLAPMDKGNLASNATFILGYDSNVLSVPSSASSATTTNNGSLKASWLLAAGYTTSPLENIQLSPSARVSYNYNFNKDTRSGSFWANTATLYVNLFPVRKTSFGLKTEGTLTFQNQPDAVTDKSTYRVYSLQGSVGPYLKQEFRNQWSASAEFLIQPSKSFGDKDLSDSLKRSGTDLPLKFSLKQDRGLGAINPSGSLNLDWNRTSGSEFRAKTVGFSGGDTIYLNEEMSLNPSLTLSQTLYNERSAGLRRDKLLVLDLSGTYRVKSTLTIIADVQWLKNYSTLEDTYQYSKWQVSSGVSYSF